MNASETISAVLFGREGKSVDGHWLCNHLSIFFFFSASLTCHSGWHLYQDSCYSYGEGKVSWTNAQEFCRTYGGNLAEIGSDDEDTFVKNMLTTRKVYQAWIGGTDILHEGHWEWISTGNDFSSYANWAPGQPDNSGSAEDCMQYQQSTSGTYIWNDASCNNLFNFVCEA
ncbi:unnamed protein product, partial [Candidula unifasciata]